MIIYGLISDLAQRIITLNKLQQRKALAEKLKELDLRPGCKALDFGCGTALFSKIFLDRGVDYYGYEVEWIKRTPK